MSFGAVAALLIGIAMLIFPAWLAWYVIRRQRRLTTWPRAEGRVRHRWKEKHQSSDGSTTTHVHARYEFRDATGAMHVGEVEHLTDPKVGDIIEIMYDPDDPKTSDTVYGGSVAGRVINYGAVFILLGGFGIFLVLASLDLLPI